MNTALITLVCVVIAAVHVAHVESVASSPRYYGQLTPADEGKLDTDSECYYNIFLTNFEQTGFGGAFVTVQMNGNDVDGFSSPGITLPDRLEQSGWVLSLSSGAELTVVYTAGSLTHAGNVVMVTDANGAYVANKSMDGETSYTFSLGKTSCACVYEQECPEVRIRNEWRSLSYCQKQLFINALNEFRFSTAVDGENAYEKFIYHHKNVTETVLEKSLFLPWHRGFIWKFENKLRALGGDYSCVSLPYWDTSMDFGYESSSELYSDLGGLSRRTCLQSPFAKWTDPIALSDPTLPYDVNCVYRRVYPADQQFEQFGTEAAFDLGIVANWDYAYIFRYLVRNPHKSVHVFIAGSMATLHSPADPLFFLHHANIDRLYALWQDCWDYDKSTDPSDQYSQVSWRTTTPVDYYMPLLYPNSSDSSNNVTIGDMFDLTKFNYRYPPFTRTLVRLNTSIPLKSAVTCKWDWMSKSVADDEGYDYRLTVHNEEQRRRFSISRAAHQEHLEGRELDYYGAIKAQMAAECELNGGYTAEDFNESFMEQADDDHITGPGDMYKNACKLLMEGTLSKLIAQCYPAYSCAP